MANDTLQIIKEESLENRWIKRYFLTQQVIKLYILLLIGELMVASTDGFKRELTLMEDRSISV